MNPKRKKLHAFSSFIERNSLFSAWSQKEIGSVMKDRNLSEKRICFFVVKFPRANLLLVPNCFPESVK